MEPRPADAAPQRAAHANARVQSRELELRELVGRIAVRDQAALAQLYDATSPALYAIALRMLANPHDAEEVVYDVYSRAWRNAPSYSEARGTVSTWLILMTRSLAIDRLRSLRRQPAANLADAPEPASSADSPETRAESDQRSRRVQAALSRLPAEQRSLLELAFFSGLSHSEIAEQSTLPLGTVKTRIRSGLTRLRTELEDLRV